MEQEKTLQDVMSGDLFSSSKGEMAEALQFMEKHAVPLSSKQLAGIALLQHMHPTRYKAFTNVVQHQSKYIARPKIFLQVIESLTLADRIKGNVRLNNIFKGDNK